MIRVDNLVTRIQSKLLDESGVRVTKLDIMDAINEAKSVIVSDLIELREGITAFLSIYDTPIRLDIPAGGSRIVLPASFAKVKRVKVLNGTDYITIQESVRGESLSGIADKSAVDILYGDTTYEIVGPFIQLDRTVTPAIPAGIELECDRNVPDLLMGTATAGAAQTITLPSSIATSTGQMPASTEDGAYLGIDIEIVSGTAIGKRGTVASYVGLTRIATMVAAWGVSPDATSVFAMWTPFRNLVADCDKLIDLGARVAILTDGKLNKDASGLATRYNRIEESLLDVLGTRSAGQRVVQPLGGYDIG